MPDLPKKKVGIIACSGEELTEGTISRLAALRVLEQTRPGDTVTLCLPLFLAGGEGDRAFARFYPTIAVDGCELHCAAKATEMYSNKPAASVVVQDIIEENRLEQPQGRRHLDEAGLQAVDLVAKQVESAVDTLLEKHWSRQQGELIELESVEVLSDGPVPEHVTATCACGSGIPIQNILIAGRQVTIVGLPLIFQQFVEARKAPNEATLAELLEIVKVYNSIPADEEPAYREGIHKAYTRYWFKDKSK